MHAQLADDASPRWCVLTLDLSCYRPPYTPYAASSAPVLLKGRGWRRIAVNFSATETASQELGNQGRVTWWFRAGKAQRLSG